MTVEIIIRDDEENIVAHHKAVAEHPTQQKREKPLFSNQYEIWGFTFAPMTRMRADWQALQDAGKIPKQDPNQPEPERVLFSR